MRKILSTFVAAALVLPASLALAEEPASAAAKKAGDEAAVAGAKAEKAGEAADQAGDKARRAGVAAERAGNKAQKVVDAKREKHLGKDDLAMKHAHQAIGALEKADPGLTKLFDGAAGYAVFATVGKGAVGVGGAHGTGVLYEKGQAIGGTTLTQLTVGLQFGGQAYTEVIFFETERSLADFKKGEFAIAAQVSAVAAAEGASANAKYVDGVSVFTLAKGGLMAEASVGGQKFSYQAYAKPTTSSL